MTDYYHTGNFRPWNAASVNYDVAEAAANAITEFPSCHARDRVFDVLSDTAERLFNLPALDLGGIIRKLTIYWGKDPLDAEPYGASFKRLFVGDLRRLERLQAGVPEPDASGGMDLDNVAQAWTEALNEHDHYDHLLREDPSKKANDRKGDIIELKDQAEVELLSLSAPDLTAVIRKLSLLWADDRFDPVSRTIGLACVLRDIRRHALLQSQ